MLKAGDRIGDWIIESPLGEGGMGAVFRVHSALSERVDAALKLMKPSLEKDALADVIVDVTAKWDVSLMVSRGQSSATFLHSAEFFGLGLDHDLRLPALLDAVTLEEANAAARRTLDPSRAAVVVAGPYDRTQGSGLKAQGRS